MFAKKSILPVTKLGISTTDNIFDLKLKYIQEALVNFYLKSVFVSTKKELKQREKQYFARLE